MFSAVGSPGLRPQYANKFYAEPKVLIAHLFGSESVVGSQFRKSDDTSKCFVEVEMSQEEAT